MVVTFGLTLAVVGGGCSSDDQGGDAGKRISTAQLIRYQEPDDTGPNPFTDRVDVRGRYRVELPASGAVAGAVLGGGGGGGGAGSPGSGSGSLPPGAAPLPKRSPPGGPVCDRYRLLKLFKHHRGRMRAWAGVLGVKPTYKDVSQFVSALHPVTLTRDTLVTAHTFASGRAAAGQTILRAGTPVLVDHNGRPIMNCTCGDPLTKPRSAIPTVPGCFSCARHYRLPPQCPFWAHAYDFDAKLYDHHQYDPGPYDDMFVAYANKSSFPFRACYVAYPHPPPMPLTLIEEIVPPPRPAPVYTAPQEPTYVPEQPTQPEQPPAGEEPRTGEEPPPAICDPSPCGQ